MSTTVPSGLTNSKHTLNTEELESAPEERMEGLHTQAIVLINKIKLGRSRHLLTKVCDLSIG